MCGPSVLIKMADITSNADKLSINMTAPQSITMATFLKRTDRYCMECALTPSGLEVRCLCSTLLPIPGMGVVGTAVQLKEQDLTPKTLPYSIEKAQVDGGAWVTVNVREAIGLLLGELINRQVIDLHELSRYKMSQIAPVISSNDLKIDLMTKNFQPHLIVIYPIFESSTEGAWEFGSRRDAWLFDYLIEMISYRRTGHKATLILYGLNSHLQKMLLADDKKNDYVKILKEGMASGIEVLKARLVVDDKGQRDLFFDSGSLDS